MSTAQNKDAKLQLKVVLNKDKTKVKVLLADADNHFTDTLLSFLTLPLGRFMRIMQNHYDAPVIGSIDSLYASLSNLDASYFWNETCKKMLLNPESTFSEECSALKLDITESRPHRYHLCRDSVCVFRKRLHSSWFLGCNSSKCSCGKSMSWKQLTLLKSPGGGVLTGNKSTFLITDDLKIFPNVTASLVQIMNELGVEAKDWGERINATFGLGEVISTTDHYMYGLCSICCFGLKLIELIGVSFK